MVTASMKATGIVRNVDELGRFVLPKELRNVLQIKPGDPLEVYVEEEMVILKKYQPTCVFCGGGEDLVDFGNKKVCKTCIDAINEKAE